jgi:hypothetical protein
MTLGNVYAVIFFIFVGFVCSFFTKNMIIIMSIPIVVTSVLMVGEKVKESFQDMMESSSSPDSGIPNSGLPTSLVQRKIKNVIYPEYEINEETSPNDEPSPNEDSMIPLDSAKIPESDA